MKIAPGVFAALAVILALVVVDTCARRDERQKAAARARDTRDDSTVSRLIHEAAVTGQRFGRERDSTSRVIANLRSRVRAASQTSPDTTVSGGTNSPAVALAPDVRDTLIAALEAGRAQDSLQLVFWKAQVQARDSLIPALQKSRDAWRSRSERRWACVVGPSAAMSLSGRGVIGIGASCGWKL